MTYEKLAQAISQMTPEQKQCDATVFDSNAGEYLPVKRVEFTEEENCNVLDDNHPILII